MAIWISTNKTVLNEKLTKKNFELCLYDQSFKRSRGGQLSKDTSGLFNEKH